MYYIMLLERRDKTEAIDILHFKIAHEMKKLLIFNCFVFATCCEIRLLSSFFYDNSRHLLTPGGDYASCIDLAVQNVID